MKILVFECKQVSFLSLHLSVFFIYFCNMSSFLFLFLPGSVGALALGQ